MSSVFKYEYKYLNFLNIQMDNTYSLEQISKTRCLDAGLILRRYELDLTSRFVEIKSNNPKLTQKQIALQLGFLDSTIERYRDQMNMPSTYNGKTTKRKKMSSRDFSVTVKGGNCENEIFLVKSYLIKLSITN